MMAKGAPSAAISRGMTLPGHEEENRRAKSVRIVQQRVVIQGRC